MVEWLAGNRIRGTSAEKPVLGLPSGSVGGWKEVGRTTLGSNGTTIDVSGLPNKRYYMVLHDKVASGTIQSIGMRINADSGSNYAFRESANGGADGANPNVAKMTGYASGTSNIQHFCVEHWSNLSTKEKLGNNHSVWHTSTGAGTAPNRHDMVGKWTNTSNPISAFNYSVAGGDIVTGSEMVVLGWDPADTHTTNFWEELASVTLGSAGDTIDSGTITAKKYLWIQGYCKNTGGDIRPTFQFNSDTGSNYANRGSSNGASDSTNTGVGRMYLSDSANQGVPIFFNIFVVNNSANEKLCIAHIIDQGTAGAGNSPNRYESVGKWANTSSQITSIQVQNDRAGDFNTGSILKVWGSN